MTPIEKNVRVVDEQGNEYEATYPKRAKGLVKNGRARFTDENTICLVRPPDIMEEKMNIDNITTVNEAEIGKIEAKAEEEYAKAGAASDTQGNGEITEAKVLALIERLTDMSERILTNEKEKDILSYKRAVITILNNSANRLLALLEKKYETMKPVSDREYIAFMVDFASKNTSGELPDFVELRKTFTN